MIKHELVTSLADKIIKVESNFSLVAYEWNFFQTFKVNGLLTKITASYLVNSLTTCVSTRFNFSHSQLQKTVQSNWI